MKKEELYIANNLVDIDSSTAITLNYKSNLFTDVSKVVSNNTYSIKLPITLRNCRIIDNAHLPSCLTRYPRINHAGRYLRNGVEIVSNANVTLMEVAETINVAMAWGNVSAFADIVNDDRKLQDLSYGIVEDEDFIVWSRELGNSPRLPWVNYGFKDDDINAWFHPAVSAKWILNRISQDSGVSFIIPKSRMEFIEQLIIPLLTREDSMERSSLSSVILTNSYLNSNIDLGIMLSFHPNEIFDNYYIKSRMSSIGDSQYIAGVICNYKNTTLQLNGTIVAKFPLELGNVTFEIRDHTFQNVIMSISPDSRQTEEGVSVLYFNLNDKCDVGDQAGEDNWLSLCLVGDVGGRTITTNDLKYLSINLTMHPYSDEIGLKEQGMNPYYFFVPNLPDIKQIDFIKTISSLCGMFAVPVEGGIRFITMDDIVENKLRALDWTKRVIASYPQNRPKLLSFRLDGFAQKNVYKWKDDETGENDGIIYVDDKTLDLETEAVTLPFAASKIKDSRTGPYTEIPLYSYNGDGELEYDDSLTPRLLLCTDGTKGTFQGLDWESIFRQNYVTYQNQVREPKVITELVNIPEYDLKSLDMSVPVYLGQYGKYYAIISIKAENTGICECKLLQL